MRPSAPCWGSTGSRSSGRGLGKWESGDAVPNGYQLLAVCHALDIEDGVRYFTGNAASPLNRAGLEKLREYKQDLSPPGGINPSRLRKIPYAM